MPNKKHMYQLNLGKDNWLSWRIKNPGIKPDMSFSKRSDSFIFSVSREDFEGRGLGWAYRVWELILNRIIEPILSNKGVIRIKDLTEIDFSNADLTGANLSGENLTKACLSGAILQGVNLDSAILEGATLDRAYLNNAYLSKANFKNASLERVDFRLTVLYGTNFRNARLSGADFTGADIIRADFTEANLERAKLNEVHLSYANFTNANLSYAELIKADLKEANLQNACLVNANLAVTQVLDANLEGANLTGACLKDWIINKNTKFVNVICQYFYLQSGQRERCPNRGEFAPGEFTKLFQKALETVNLIFADGIDWKAFLLSFQELQAEYGEENLSVQAIEKKSGGAFVIRLEVPPEANKADIEFRGKELYQRHISLLEGQLKDKENLLNDYKKIVNDTCQDNTDFKKLIKTLADNRPTININMEAKAESNSMSESYQSKYDQIYSNSQFVDTAQSGSNPTFNQYNYTPEQRQNLVEAAKEIEALLQHLQQSYPTTTTSEKMSVVAKAVDEIERNPTLKARVIGALKAGGTEAFKELVDNPLINILLASIEGWQEAE
ncbi:pentapeptide repeat-containing protein [Nostoc sp. LEGE 06077]|uniref:pentapeptide repeat-containing protein n=1 Tax=Nostoc sp. LEGE 06077 TaxID=915325 RepID=UPI001882ADD5|nr:pentapeptide repeat-containing protein [Nostoc sp. LEGE 06077]MBE9209231.1 pentapeptide repeat-containing protein [Nostoc sp. LEGE 06077]